MYVIIPVKTETTEIETKV